MGKFLGKLWGKFYPWENYTIGAIGKLYLETAAAARSCAVGRRRNLILRAIWRPSQSHGRAWPVRERSRQCAAPCAANGRPMFYRLQRVRLTGRDWTDLLQAAERWQNVGGAWRTAYGVRMVY